jgi:hypothetical protein
MDTNDKDKKIQELMAEVRYLEALRVQLEAELKLQKNKFIQIKYELQKNEKKMRVGSK